MLTRPFPLLTVWTEIKSHYQLAICHLSDPWESNPVVVGTWVSSKGCYFSSQLGTTKLCPMTLGYKCVCMHSRNDYIRPLVSE